jgi:hypothetical protein
MFCYVSLYYILFILRRPMDGCRLCHVYVIVRSTLEVKTVSCMCKTHGT